MLPVIPSRCQPLHCYYSLIVFHVWFVFRVWFVFGSRWFVCVLNTSLTSRLPCVSLYRFVSSLRFVSLFLGSFPLFRFASLFIGASCPSFSVRFLFSVLFPSEPGSRSPHDRVAEWSKAVALGAIHVSDAGSNPVLFWACSCFVGSRNSLSQKGIGTREGHDPS